MNITPSQNRNQINFGSVNLIQISKKAFQEPENLKLVSKTFDKTADKITGEFIGKIPKPIATILTLLGLAKKGTKTGVYLESPLYRLILKDSQGPYSLNWHCRNLGVPVLEPLNENYHSFYVHTKENKDYFLSLFHGEGQKALSQELKIEINKKFPKDAKDVETMKDIKTQLRQIWMFNKAKMDQLITERLNNFNKGGEVNKFVINDLSELPDVFKKIDY